MPLATVYLLLYTHALPLSSGYTIPVFSRHVKILWRICPMQGRLTHRISRF
jgi:hypothetical protein